MVYFFILNINLARSSSTPFSPVQPAKGKVTSARQLVFTLLLASHKPIWLVNPSYFGLMYAFGKMPHSENVCKMPKRLYLSV